MHTSHWITCPGVQYSENKLYWFRRTVELPKAPVSAVLHIAAETRYKLFVNGKRVAFGSLRTSAYEKYYDTIDIAPYLQEGKNELFCEVLQLAENCDFTKEKLLYALRRTGNMGLAVKLTCTMDGEEDVVIRTDDRWEVCPSPADTFPVYNGDMRVSGLEQHHVGGGVPEWKNAYVFQKVDCVRKEPFMWGAPNDLFLYPRTIPMLYQKEVSFAKTGEGYWLAEELTFGLPRYVFSGTGTVKINYAECFGIRGDKEDRLDSSKVAEQMWDVVEVNGRTEYEPFWFRTCRIIQMTFEGDVTLDSLAFTEVGYPLEVPEGCDFGSETDNRLWKISVATLMRCMQESYEDCPYYEQMQYAMDTSLQMVYNYQLSGDDALARKAIHDFQLSQRGDGLLNSRYPSLQTQYIPSFSFYYIFMIAEHYKRFGDKKLVRENLRTIDGVLEWFDGQMDPCGLLRHTEYWDFLDWSGPWMRVNGEAWIGGETIVTILSAMYVYALREGAKLAELCGRACVAGEYRERAARVADRIEALAWNEEKGLYADDPAKEYYSQHMQVWCVLSGIAEGEKARRIMENSLELEAASTQAFAYFYFRALEAVGLYDRTGAIMDKLREFVALNCTTIPETPVAPRSECHAWGSVAVYEFAAVVLGVRTVSAAEKRVQIKPWIEGRDHARGTVFTVGGSITVDWKIEDGWFRMRVAAPRGLRQEIVLPNGAVEKTDRPEAVYICKL